MRRTVPPSAEIQASIDKLLASKMVDDPSRRPWSLVAVNVIGQRTRLDRSNQTFDAAIDVVAMDSS